VSETSWLFSEGNDWPYPGAGLSDDNPYFMDLVNYLDFNSTRTIPTTLVAKDLTILEFKKVFRTYTPGLNVYEDDRLLEEAISNFIEESVRSIRDEYPKAVWTSCHVAKEIIGFNRRWGVFFEGLVPTDKKWNS